MGPEISGQKCSLENGTRYDFILIMCELRDIKDGRSRYAKKKKNEKIYD